jgi:hypothetical protein
MQSVMIDIESMSTRTDALVLSAAVQFFELNAETPVLGDARVWVFDIREQLATGRHVDEKTVKWWAEQSDAARAHWRRPAVVTGLVESIVDLRAFVGAAPNVWANGAQFDIVTLETLMLAYGLSPGWAYNAIRDARTIYKVCPKVRELGESKELVSHEPLSDCIYQIFKLWEHWPDRLEAPKTEAA